VAELPKCLQNRLPAAVAGLANPPIFAILERTVLAGFSALGPMMPGLRLIAVVLLVSSALVAPAMRALAEPLDKASCASLADERKKLLTPSMQAALDRGPDWVKDHLNDEELDKVREFLDVEAKITFQCRGGGIDKKKVTAAPAPPDPVPLPDRKPVLDPADAPNTGPSQTVADSDKTAPSKAKATR
jgi:hypothetical protein